jgi:hypothetical protein
MGREFVFLFVCFVLSCFPLSLFLFSLAFLFSFSFLPSFSNSKNSFDPSKDPFHDAGVGGNAEASSTSQLNILLKKLSKKLLSIVEWKRPDVHGILLRYNILDEDFTFCPLFMCPRGACDMHNDPNDFLSIVVGIQNPKLGCFFFLFYFL